MTRIKIAAVCLESAPNNKSQNLKKIEEYAAKLTKEGAQLICYPAMAITGYWQTASVTPEAEILKVDADNPALVYPAGPSVKKIEATAKNIKNYLAVGIIEDLDYYHMRNSVGLFGPNGHIGTTGEVHTSKERHFTYAGSRQTPLFDMDGIKIGVLVGKDVYYPEIARILTLQGADVLVVAMATPVASGKEAIENWREKMSKILATRAMENDVAIVAVEAAGSSTNKVEKTSQNFVGQSMMFTPDGRMVAQTPADNQEKVLTAEIDIAKKTPEQLKLRRPELYNEIAKALQRVDIPGTRKQDWDAQGELIWSRLRDMGFFCVDLYDASRPADKQSDAVVVTASSLPNLDAYKAVILTRPCLSTISAKDLKGLSDWVKAGGTVILDGYCGRNAEVLADLTGIKGSMECHVHIPSYTDASRVTVRVKPAVEDAIFEGMNIQYRSKVWGQVWQPVDSASVKAQPLADIYSPQDEKVGTGIYRNKVGKGTVYTFAYSSAYSQLLLMEGRGTTEDVGSFPTRVAAGVPKDGDVCIWGDQVITDSEDQFFPSADYHLIPVVNILRAAVSEHVLLSLVPEGKDIGVIFTGDSDRANSEKVNNYTKLLKPYGIKPTQFICREGYDAKEFDTECEYGIHPLFHETEQICFDNLVSYGLDPKKLICGRRHCLIQYGLTETLERMAKCGVRYTSNNWDFPYPETNSTAFLFGTTLAHQIYDWQGKKIGIVDVPQVFMDYEPMLECTQKAYYDTKKTHGVSTWNFHPQNQVMGNWVNSIKWLAEQVKKDGAWCGTVGEYGDWYLEREKLTIKTTGEGVEVKGKISKPVTLLSKKKDITINGKANCAKSSSNWYGQDYWIHVVEAK